MANLREKDGKADLHMGTSTTLPISGCDIAQARCEEPLWHLLGDCCRAPSALIDRGVAGGSGEGPQITTILQGRLGQYRLNIQGHAVSKLDVRIYIHSGSDY